MESLQHFQNTSSSCLTSCLLVIPDLTLQLEDQYLRNSLIQKSKETSIIDGQPKGIYLFVPRDVSFIESMQAYTLFTALADLLGIASLFFGISVIGFVNPIVRAFIAAAQKLGFKASLSLQLENIFRVVLEFVYVSLILLIVIVYLSKYNSFPVETNIALENSRPPLSMAFCHSKYITWFNSSEKALVSLSKNISYWQDGVDIRKKISRLSVMNSAGDWSSIWNATLPTVQDAKAFSRIIYPLGNQTVQFCDMFDLQQYLDVPKVI